jgi:hypothetical protein
MISALERRCLCAKHNQRAGTFTQSPFKTVPVEPVGSDSLI